MHISAGDFIMAVDEVYLCQSFIDSSALMIVRESLLDIEGKTLGTVDHAYLKRDVADRVKGQWLYSQGIHQQSIGTILFIEKHIVEKHTFHSQGKVCTPDAIHGHWRMVIGFCQYSVPFLRSDKIIVFHCFAKLRIVFVFLRNESVTEEQNGRDKGQRIDIGLFQTDCTGEQPDDLLYGNGQDGDNCGA